MNEKQFIEGIEKLNIKYTKEMLNKLEKYYNILVTENEKYNLTAITNKEDVYLKHFYDSLTITSVVDLTKELELCDLGSGAGFPGIVLSIFFPQLNITLVDSSNKKVSFLNLVKEQLNIKNLEIITSRVEELEIKEKYDIVTARAVAPLNILLEISIKLIKINGYFIAMKGKKGIEEVEQSKHCIEKLSLEVKKVEKIALINDSGERTIIKLEKIKKTSKMYPRNYSQIKKYPL